MTIHDWGEDRLIETLSTLFPHKKNIVGIGDDCAVIHVENGKSMLVTTDALVEGIHFLKDQISGKDLGYKTAAVNISDIAAMGGFPEYAFLTIAIPKDIEKKWLEDLFLGMKETMEEYHLQLLGGDTVGSKRDIFINLTVIGSAQTHQIKYRNMAKEGDLICVTGALGDSGGGLKAIQKKLKKTKEVERLIKAHFRPRPHLKEGQGLASCAGVHSMMDLSDGLNCDLNRLTKASQCGATIELSQLPISDDLKAVCEENHWDPIELALTGGEDYCLLVTISPENFEAIKQQYPLHEIGKITKMPQQIVYSQNGTPLSIKLNNFDHFK